MKSLKKSIKRKRKDSDVDMLDAEDKSPESKTSHADLTRSMPSVLLALCFSYLTGVDRQHLSLVCKVWSVVEKTKNAWPNSIDLSNMGIQDLMRLAPRLQHKRFSTVSLDTHNRSIADAKQYVLACTALCQNIKTKRLLLATNDFVPILRGMNFVNELQRLYVSPVWKMAESPLLSLPPMPALTELTAVELTQTGTELVPDTASCWKNSYGKMGTGPLPS